MYTSKVLHFVHTQSMQRKVLILLIDEYDVPIAKADAQGYYDQMLEVISPMLGTALKDNNYLKFAVITGCLRITKESIFTGTDNFVTDTISDSRYNEYFGFTHDEVQTLLADTQCELYADSENLTYNVPTSSEQNLWSLLYLTGYLTKADSTDISPETKLKIPNAEVMEIFRKNVAEWFTDSVIQSDRRQIFVNYILLYYYIIVNFSFLFSIMKGKFYVYRGDCPKTRADCRIIV